MTAERLKLTAGSAILVAFGALLALIYLCLPTAAFAVLIYVDSNSGIRCNNATGTSWSTAFPDISCGLNIASSGDTVIVRARGIGRDNEYGGFTMADGVTVQSESQAINDPLLDPPFIKGSVTFSSGTTSVGSILDGFEILGSSSVYISGTATNINNNAIIRNCLINTGGRTGVKWNGGSPIFENNEFTGKPRTAVRFLGPAGTSSEAAILRGNNFHANGTGGSGNTMYAEIHFEKGEDARYVLIQDNSIHENSYAAGISIDGANNDTLYIVGNDIYNNPFAGIRVGNYQEDQTAQTGRITISGETTFTFPPSGPTYTNGAPNKIHNNGRGGIGIGVDSTVDIISNEIYSNGWGGIHTGMEEPLNPQYSWPGTVGNAVLTIRKNKVYGNGTGTDSAGGGIDVRYASGIIQNNLVYENKKGGIRIGAGDVTSIRNNTVADNGKGGIVYTDSSNGYDAIPTGTIPSGIDIKNNIVANNIKGAMRGLGFTNTGDLERNYNLIYGNNYNSGWKNRYGGDWRNCTGIAGPIATMICYKRNYGGFGYDRANTLWDPNDIVDDPLFADATNDNYTLSSGSPAKGTGSDGTDMGAWGGNYPMDW